MSMEKIVKVTYTTGGTGGTTTRITLATKMIEALGVTRDDREVKVRLEDGKIIIEKA